MKKYLIFLLFLMVSACAPVAVTPEVTPTFVIGVTATPKPTITPTATPETAEIIADSLHVRNKPMGLRIGYLYHADAVILTGKCLTGWAQIEWQDGTGWVNSKFLSSNSCQTNKE